MENNYSPLPPFDLEKAKAGELLTTPNGALFVGKPIWKYAAGPDKAGNIIVEKLEDGKFAQKAPENCFRMVPLCWIENLPVYKGDVLYRTELMKFVTAESIYMDCDGDEYLCFKEGGNVWFQGPYNTNVKLSWNKPKQKREGWINIYSGKGVSSYIHISKEEALRYAESDLIDTIKIEWYE